MKSVLKYFFLITFSFLLAGCSILPSGKKAALSIETTPNATVFLDGEHLGQTPIHNEKLKAGQYVLKIVPESTGQALNPWEGRITLSSNILTVVKRELGLTADTSSGEILSFEPLADKNATSISVITNPDGAVINLDGEPQGYAPLSIDNISQGEHVLVITSTGFNQKTIKAKAVKGNKLIASIQLSREELAYIPEKDTNKEATPSATPKSSPKATPKSSPKATLTELNKPYVEITSEVGWARVRQESNTASDELGKVDLGEKFNLLETTTTGNYDWYKIEYKTDEKGWIREDLAKIFE
ncbi:MAG: PEGA domain-containing protein [Patescibacteria group bacterium]|nr:PEGA domain-containing protein [Patescibacteria group bacterium]